MERETIIERILKVYNKSKNNPSEEEAKAALLKVQEMLAKYNLQLKDLKAEEKKPVIEIELGKKCRWWHGGLARILATNLKCKSYTSNYIGGRRIVFVGEELDVQICSETFKYIKNAITYNCKIHMSTRKLKLKERIKIAKESFITGFLNGLEYALDEQKACNEWGLVLAAPIAVQEFYSNLNLTTFRWEKSTGDKNDERAYRDGYVKGKEFDTNKDKLFIM